PYMKPDGKILVPFAVESSLSGVGKSVSPSQELYYAREFTIPSQWKEQRVLLNFGAVDWRADVWVNEVKVGEHTGGYTPFSFDITSAISRKGVNNIVVKVWDGTDSGFQPRGKQVSKPGGIWYTPVTGIWQTVWLEPTSLSYITDVRSTPDIDNNILKVDVLTAAKESVVSVVVKDGDKIVASGRSLAGVTTEIKMPKDAKLWSPESPFLYDMEVSIASDGVVTDKVESYAAMRKFSTARDASGIVRLQLNNKNLFQFGPLDQGWWPDGLYTAPCDEALKYDIIKTKDFGFNMIRKHVKVEPARWYTHCDQLGVIVWQDMPNGDQGGQWIMDRYYDRPENPRRAESIANYKKEWKEIMDYLYSHPSIGVWVPFNEGWGQFNTTEIAAWTKAYDPTRLVNPASGGNHFSCGDMLDIHHYPNPAITLYEGARATVLGEYGGIGLVFKDNVWEKGRNWGYVQYENSKDVTDKYIEYTEMLKNLIRSGISGAVYTQTTDVEIEVNGFMTYDRKIIKMDEQRIKKANAAVCGLL
ncbi:MAG: glycoside hydrolase family 2 TIM barrel-domain containing protein, partial [Rikenellaceae bacterium]